MLNTQEKDHLEDLEVDGRIVLLQEFFKKVWVGDMDRIDLAHHRIQVTYSCEPIWEHDVKVHDT